jgi:hypothetical protein
MSSICYGETASVCWVCWVCGCAGPLNVAVRVTASEAEGQRNVRKNWQHVRRISISLFAAVCNFSCKLCDVLHTQQGIDAHPN